MSIIVRAIGRPTLLEALESLAAQNERDFEVVLVDMSDGKMEAQIAAVGARLPSLQHLRIGKRLTRPVALNHGIEKARAEYIGILDDDNLYLPRHLSRLRERAERGQADLIYTGVLFRSFTADHCLISEERRFQPYDFARLLEGNYIFASTAIYRKEAWRRAGRYDPRFPIYEDWEFLLRLTRNASVESFPGHSAISRSFLGVAGVPEHHCEKEECERCINGLYWKHRRLFGKVARDRFRNRAALELLVEWRRRTRLLTDHDESYG